MTENKDLADALVQVRSAYRILWSYQRRMFDIIDMIAAEFSAHNFYKWTIDHARRQCNPSTNPSQRRAWDMLPMMNTSYFYAPDGVDANHPRKGQWVVEMVLNSDSGFEETAGKSEPDPDNFEKVEDCESTLGIYVWQYRKDSSLGFFKGPWNEIEYYPDPDEDPPYVESPDGTLRGIGREVDISALPDADSVRRVVEKCKKAAAKRLGIEFD